MIRGRRTQTRRKDTPGGPRTLILVDTATRVNTKVWFVVVLLSRCTEVAKSDCC